MIVLCQRGYDIEGVAAGDGAGFTSLSNDGTTLVVGTGGIMMEVESIQAMFECIDGILSSRNGFNAC